MKHEPDTGPNVTVYLGDQAFELKRGSHTIGEIREMFGLSAEYVLDQVIEGQLVARDDSFRLTLKGGERFAKHVRRGQAA